MKATVTSLSMLSLSSISVATPVQTLLSRSLLAVTKAAYRFARDIQELADLSQESVEPKEREAVPSGTFA